MNSTEVSLIWALANSWSGPHRRHLEVACRTDRPTGHRSKYTYGLVRGQQFQVAIEIRALTIFCHGWLYAHGTLITASHASMRVLGVFIVVDASVIDEVIVVANTPV